GWARKKAEDWVKKFLAGGAEEGITNVFDSFGHTIAASIPYAERIGDIFGRIANLVSGVMLLPKELNEWMTGSEKKGNFMSHFFGASDDSEFLAAFKTMLGQMMDAWKVMFSSMSIDFNEIIQLMKYAGEILAPIVRMIGNTIEIAAAM